MFSNDKYLTISKLEKIISQGYSSISMTLGSHFFYLPCSLFEFLWIFAGNAYDTEYFM